MHPVSENPYDAPPSAMSPDPPTRYVRANQVLAAVLGLTLISKAPLLLDLARAPWTGSGIAGLVMFALIALFIPSYCLYLVLLRRHEGYLLAVVLCGLSVSGVSKALQADVVLGLLAALPPLVIAPLAIYVSRGLYGALFRKTR